MPEFRSEDHEREFWAKHDSTEFIDWRESERLKLPNLKPTLRTAMEKDRRRPGPQR